MLTGTFACHTNFPSQYVKSRRVDIWLPPGYDKDKNGRFPTLYMHDGQNIFFPEYATNNQTWGIPEVMSQLIANGDAPPTIVVGVWCTNKRFKEYMPERPLTTQKGQSLLQKVRHKFQGKVISDNYLKFLTTELKPFIDSTYPTLPEREHTTIMGSSMGGLISLYALCEYPHIFRAAGCVSTHWPAGDGIVLDYLKSHIPAPGTHKIYFDYGTETLDAEYEPYQLQADVIMRVSGYTKNRDWITQRFDGAAHNELSWRERVHIPLKFLLEN